jgi:hypothetical protein
MCTGARIPRPTVHGLTHLVFLLPLLVMGVAVCVCVQCQHHATGSSPHAETDYMRYGTPVDVGRCAKQVIANLTKASPAGAAGEEAAAAAVAADNILAFVASDNHGSATQVRCVVPTHPLRRARQSPLWNPPPLPRHCDCDCDCVLCRCGR